VRVIGYTDPTGTADGNDALATMRAEKVAAELERLGVPKDRLKVLGRPRGTLLSYDKGPFSSNRRVEFEISYIGEPTVPRGEPLSADAKGL
jgi:outer membrane protein OmpA-like peptidoglycan-associated protein